MAVVGIDPDSDKFGVCVFHSESEFELKSLDLFDLIDFVIKNKDYNYIIEDILSTNYVYNQKGFGKNYLAKRSNNVGQCQHSAKLVLSFFEKNNLKIHKVKPLKGTKDIKTLLFNQITKDKAKMSNQDQRDAFLIAYNFTKTKKKT